MSKQKQTYRLPPETHAKIVDMAKSRGVSQAAILAEVVAKAHEDFDPGLDCFVSIVNTARHGLQTLDYKASRKEEELVKLFAIFIRLSSDTETWGEAAQKGLI